MFSSYLIMHSNLLIFPADKITVDESLFQNLDDLDISDEDDEDYVPGESDSD